MQQYDVIVLGTGGAGYQVAMKAKQAGWSVAVVNDGLAGGTCSVRGCIPKKVLAGTAEVVDTNRRLGDIGIMNNQPSVSWSDLIAFKRTFTDPVPGSTEKALTDAGIDLYRGSSKFISNLTLEVNSETLSAKKIHIAVGATPAQLSIEGAEHLINSDDFLELDELPKRIVFVGGGYVSFEFAHVAARFGADVTILHSNQSPLAMFDQDMIQSLLEASKEVGIQVELGAGVSKIVRTGDTVTITTTDGRTFEADAAVHGAGRTPAIADLDLAATGVEFDLHRGVLVDEHLRSVSNPDVYAAGDAAAAGPPLSPVAGVQGGIVAENLLGGDTTQPSYLSTPSVIFTTPVVASVGYSEAAAKDKGLDVDVINTDTSTWFDAKRVGQKFSKSKVLVEKSTNKILGAHLIGNHAEDLINIFSLAVELGLITEQLKQPIMAFPTASDDMRSMF